MTVTMAAYGSVVIPLEARRNFGMENGGVLSLSVAKNGCTLLSTDESLYDGEIWSDEEKAEILPGNAVTQEEWDEIFAILLAEGVDPAQYPSIDLSAKSALPTDAEWEARKERARTRYLEAQQVA